MKIDPSHRIHGFCLALATLLAIAVRAEETAQFQGMKEFRAVIFGCRAADLSDFENFAIEAKSLGATHIQINAEDLPLDYSLLDPPNDPYPAWAITNPDLLKIAYPDALAPYVNQEYAETVMSILAKRCELLRKHGLKAVFQTYAPQMLPEAVFRDHPLWRGARVENPRRARLARFAPSIDNPDVLALYRESLAKFIGRCPEVDIVILRTNDSGAGVDWSARLYSGANGNSRMKYRSMADRLNGFFNALKQGAADAGGHIDVDLYNMWQTDLPLLASALEPGTAIEHLEGPDATPFYAEVDSLFYYSKPFAPARGIPWPLSFLRDLENANASAAPRLAVSIGDWLNRDLYLQIYKRFRAQPSVNTLSRLQLLRDIAVEQLGEEHADTLLAMWESLDQAWNVTKYISGGGTIFQLGGVHQRWIIRPLVPFPEQLKQEDRDYYRRFQFQARSEDDANDLIDIQSDHHLHGWSGYYSVWRLMMDCRSHTAQAQQKAHALSQSFPDGKGDEYALLYDRLQVFRFLIDNVDNVVRYQALLDYARATGQKPEPLQDLMFLSTEPSWQREMILETARNEIDNSAELLNLLEKRQESELIDVAGDGQQPFQCLLAPNVAEDLRTKLRIMNEHWEDYGKIYTEPN